MSIFDTEQKVEPKRKVKRKTKKSITGKSKKTLIRVPLLIAITVAFIGVASAGAGVFLYKEQKTPSFTASISDIIYETVYEKKFEAEKLGQELELSKFKEEQAEQKAEEELTKRIEAESAKEEAEQKAMEEAIKRSQEEALRKVKEKELAEKEEEERELSEDKDGDGLTYREELNLGTSDWDTDSDDDGIPDSLDSHPAGGGRLLIAQHFEWDYQGKHWTWDNSFPSDWHDDYKDKEHGYHGANYVTYWDTYVIEIADMLKEKANKNGYSESQFAVAFIQSLGYVGDEIIGYDDYPKYPLETLAEQNGDCEDTSYLAAAIISAMNIDVVLIELPGHMAIAVAFSGSPEGYYYSLSNGRNYYYLETTAKGWWLGELPEEYKYTEATLVKIPSNETEEKRPSYIPFTTCWAMPDYPGYYYDKEANIYHDSNCTQPFVKGCYKSKTYPTYFYKSGYAWYYDSRCTQIFKSMSCDYPSYYSYTCTQEYQYTSKQSSCGRVRALCSSSGILGSPMCGYAACLEELNKCRNDINEYQSKLNEYNQCWDRKEY